MSFLRLFRLLVGQHTVNPCPNGSFFIYQAIPTVLRLPTAAAGRFSGIAILKREAQIFGELPMTRNA